MDEVRNPMALAVLEHGLKKYSRNSRIMTDVLFQHNGIVRLFPCSEAFLPANSTAPDRELPV
jgi:hypothetical protein